MKMIEKHKKTYLYLLFFISFILLAIIIVNKRFQNDTFYTIKVGEVISKYGVDMKDHFSFVSGLAYTYPHWLYDFFIYKLYSFGGYDALYASSIVFTIILSSVMFLTMTKVNKDEGIAFILSALLTTFMINFIAVRAQLVSYILLILILFSIEMIRKTNQNRYLLLAFISSILIVNMHCAVYYFIFILFIPYLVSDLAYVIKNKFFKNWFKDSIIEIDKPSNTKKLFIMMFLVLISGLIAPNAPTAYSYLPLTLMGESTGYINEHAAASLSNNPLVFVHLLIFLGLLLIPKVKIKLHDMFMIVGMFIAAFMSIRSFSLYIIITIFAYSRIIYKISYDRLKHIKISDIYRIKLVYIGLIFFAGIGAFISFINNKDKAYINKNSYPVDMVKYIKLHESDKEMRILNNYNFGSYLILNDIKVFIDSRADLYLPEFNEGCNQFIEAMNLVPNFKTIKNKYDITHILIYKNSSLNYFMEYQEDFKLVREDEHFVLYERI